MVRIQRLPCVSDCPGVQIVAIGTQNHEGITGLERTREILNEKLEDDEPGPDRDARPRDMVLWKWKLSFAYDTRKKFAQVSFRRERETVRPRWPFRSGKIDDHRAIAAFYVPTSGRLLVDGMDLSTVKRILTAHNWASCCRNFFFSMARSGKRSFCET